jgi:hypothetical protein
VALNQQVIINFSMEMGMRIMNSGQDISVFKRLISAVTRTGFVSDIMLYCSEHSAPTDNNTVTDLMVLRI